MRRHRRTPNLSPAALAAALLLAVADLAAAEVPTPLARENIDETFIAEIRDLARDTV